jgi:hypothetical protein
MTTLIRSLITLCLSLALLSCAQSVSSPDYRDELGSNGLLTPRAVFARYTEALGGERVLRSHESKTLSGDFALSSFGLSGTMDMKVAAPNLVSQTIELSGLGTINSGYNGEVAWSSDPLQGTQRLTGQTLNDMVRQSQYFLPLTYAELYPQQETVGLSEINGVQAYEVKLTDTDGGETTMWFNAETGLMIRSIATISSPAGVMRTVTDILEYREFDGETVPISMAVDQAGQQVDIEIYSVSFNDVSAEDFTPPNGL